MKYVVIIADGAADRPIADLAGQTPFQAARTPNLDALARAGRLGTAGTTPPGFLAGSDVCTMSLLGYDPREHHTGRAPLEAAALGLDMAPGQWCFRLNLVTVGEEGTPDEGLMLDHSAGGVSDEEAVQLFDAVQQHWQVTIRHSQRDFLLRPSVSYRAILLDRTGRSYAGVRTTPPHEIPREPWAAHAPHADAGAGSGGGAAAAVLNTLMLQAGDALIDHPVNQARVARGQRQANMAWVWGAGTRPSLNSFAARFGVARGAMITAVDLLAGLARLIGWDRLAVPGVTSYHDTDYAAQGRATIDALADHDVVLCHVEAPDEASHQGDVPTKVAAIEAIDAKVVGPVASHLRTLPAWRLLYLPDHYTLCSTRKHDATPVPFLIAGTGVTPPTAPAHRFTEALAQAADLHLAQGHDLMDFFLRLSPPARPI